MDPQIRRLVCRISQRASPSPHPAALAARFTRAAGSRRQGPKADWANAYAEPWIFEGQPEAALDAVARQARGAAHRGSEAG